MARRPAKPLWARVDRVGRPVALRLRSGEAVEGLLVRATEEWLAVEVDDRLLEVAEPEVVELRYLDGGEGWAKAPRGSAQPNPGPVFLERHELDPSARLEELLGLLEREAPLLALVRGTHVPGLTRAAKGLGFQLHALHHEVPDDLADSVPYVIELEPGARWVRSLIKRVSPHGALFLKTQAPAREMALFLRGFLSARLENGRQVGLRLYDPRVMRGYLECLAPEDAGLLFGAAWCRSSTDGHEELLCPCCDAEVTPLQLACTECPVRFSGEITAPFLIENWWVEDPLEHHVLWKATPFPTAAGAGRQPPTRPLQRRRKQLVLRGPQLAHLAADYRERRRAAGLPVVDPA